jgi:hypothetical protein
MLEHPLDELLENARAYLAAAALARAARERDLCMRFVNCALSLLADRRRFWKRGLVLPYAA